MSAFFSRSERVVADFLNTVVIVDDQAFIRKSEVASASPVIPSGRANITDTEIDAPQIPTEDDNSLDEQHHLDSQAVIESFAEKEIVCSVLQPDEHNREQMQNIVPNLARAADILIIDWQIRNDDGELAKNCLAEMIQSGLHPNNYLQLFVIYTGEGDITPILTAVREVLGDDVEESNRDNQITLGSTRTVVLRKATSVYDEISSEIVVPFDELADRVIKEYTQLTQGLLRNAVLKSLAAIRKQTHHILSRFPATLDYPYLAHRAVLPNPADAEFLVQDIISQELQAILEQQHVGAEVDDDAIEAFLDDLDEVEKLSLADKSIEGKENWKKLLTGGIPAVFPDEEAKKQRKLSGKLEDLLKKGDIIRSLTQTLNEEQRYKAHEDFALLTTHRPPSILDNLPRLTFGTIIGRETVAEDNINYEYFLCLQPLCDTVRLPLTQPSVFIFMQLDLSLTEGKSRQNYRFDLVVQDHTNTIESSDSKKYLTFNFNASNIHTFSFVPSPSKGFVEAELSDDRFSFTDNDGYQLQFCGELRRDIAQRAVNRLASHLSRVGIDQSEWLRLRNTAKWK